MLRTSFLLVAVLTIAATASVGMSARADQGPNEHFAKCAKVCADCRLECDTCAKHCLSLLTDGKKEHARTVQLCADCGECCKACSTLCARESYLSPYMLECCAKCCDDCVASCEKFSSDERMTACMKSCQECAKDCRALLKHLGK